MTDDLLARLHNLESRNTRVDENKAWETSWTRKLSIMAITYAVVVIFLTITGGHDIFIAALVPPTGYFLSTLGLPWLKSEWSKRHRPKQSKVLH